MRLVWTLVVIAASHFSVPARAQQPPPQAASSAQSATEVDEGNEDDEGSSDRVVAKKVALPPVTFDQLSDPRPLSELVEAFDAKQLEIPAAASVEELVQYLNQLSKLNEQLTADYRNIQLSLNQAQAKAADAILSRADEVSDSTFYLAARLGLSGRISQIPYASSQEQQQTHRLVSRQLEIGARQGLKIDEVRNATRAAEFLERYGERSLALQACSSYGETIRGAAADRYGETLERLEDTCRRLELLGKPLQLSGTTLKGEPLSWADYRGKVVLVSFWAAWSLPCQVELAELKQHYETYNSRGFDIVGISLDRDRSQLESTIAQEQVPWTNLFQANAGTNHPMALKYGVRRVPTAFLVDREGTVLSTQARGAELQRWFYRLFGPKSFVAREMAIESRWEDAAEELERLVAEEPQTIDFRLALAAVQLRGGDTQGYARTCRSSWDLFTDDNSQLPPVRLIPLLCLPGEIDLDREQIYASAVQLRRENGLDDSKLAVIMAAYRAGRDQESLNEELDSGDSFSVTIARLTHAMAAQRLGDDELARQRLDEGRALVALRFFDLLGDDNEGVAYKHWICCVVAKLILQEAESLVGSR